MGVIFVGNTIGSLLEGLVLAFAIGLGVIATIDGLRGCDSSYTPRQRDSRVDGILVLGLVILLMGHTAFAIGLMLGAYMAMRALQSLYKAAPQPAQVTAHRRTM